MKRAATSGRFCKSSALMIVARTVCPRSDGTSLPRAMLRTLPSLISCMAMGGADQPMSIWPDITAVRVAGGLPVGVGFALTPSSSTNASTILWELDPLVEYATVLRAVASARDLRGDSARTYQ